MDEDNGILAQIPGEHVARAGNLLPPAAAGEDSIATVLFEVPDVGYVRMRFKLMSSRRGKSRLWFWTATHAELSV